MMKMRIVPIAATFASPGEALLPSSGGMEIFRKKFSLYAGCDHAYLLNSGLSSFYVILKTLCKCREGKTDVILPAFTADTLVMILKKAGLRPVLCDISMEDFNMDAAQAVSLVTDRTLAVCGIHMFGIVNRGIRHIREQLPGVFVIEDCAQAQGSLLCGKRVGLQGDVSFFSFNKGKNMPTFRGGCIVTSNTAIAQNIEDCLHGIKIAGSRGEISIKLKMTLLAILANPYIYGIFYDIIGALKDKKPPTDVRIGAYTDAQSDLGIRLLKRADCASAKRYENGMRVLNGLSGVQGVILPKISTDTRPAFNRLPVIFRDLKIRDAVKEALFAKGIETGSLYPEPIHHSFDLGYKRDDFPNAVYAATHSWTFPVHPGVDNRDIDVMIDVIRKIAG